MLSAIESYIRSRQSASLKDISIHFSIHPEALEPMLGILSRKGRIRTLPPVCPSGSCAGCASVCADRAAMMFYECCEDEEDE